MAKNDVIQYLKQDDVTESFERVVGAHNAGAYLASVMIAVRNSNALMACSPQSIYIQALRATALRLSCDPSTRQAYLVPFKGQAVLIVGYIGYKQLALRTGKYRYLNVGAVYEGEEAVEDRISGLHRIEGQRTSKEVIGWIGAFELMDGYAKTIYMSIEDIHERAKRYSPSYAKKDGAWQTHTQDMEKKTVFRELLIKDGILEQGAREVLHNLEQEEELGYVDIESAPLIQEAQEPGPKKSVDQELLELGFTPPEPTGPGEIELDKDMETKTAIEVQQVDYKALVANINWQGLKHNTPELAYWGLISMLGYDTEAGRDILKRAEGDFKTALIRLWLSITPIERVPKEVLR